MGQLVRMPLDGGGEMLIEAFEDDHRGNDRVGRGDGAVRSAAETLQDALTRVRPAAEAVLAEFCAMEHGPSKINLEFGIKVTGEARLAIAKAGSEANFAVSVEWTRPE